MCYNPYQYQHLQRDMAARTADVPRDIAVPKLGLAGAFARLRAWVAPKPKAAPVVTHPAE